MKYAVIKTGGKQYKVSEGDVIEVEKLDIAPEKDYSFENVLLYVSDGDSKIGMPMLEDVKVTGKVLGQIKGEKIRVSKYKAKVRYRKTIGHRQLLTKIKIEKISAKGESEKKEVKETKKSAEK